MKKLQKNNSDAMYQLGIFYQYGLGIQKDFKQAKNWYEKASEKNEIAQLRLGEMFAAGLGVDQDVGIANSWFKKTCNNNLKKACQKLITTNPIYHETQD